MAIASLTLNKDYWVNFEITEKDIQFLHNHLLEVEQPQTTQELVHALVAKRIQEIKLANDKQQKPGGSIYYPKDHFQVGKTLQFPNLNWQAGKVISVRPGSNPGIPSFEVIEVEFDNNERKQFAAGLENHILNQPITFSSSDPMLDEGSVINHFGDILNAVLEEKINSSDELVRIANRWFPRALLVDINVGHLNLAEAVLDMMGGGPLAAKDLVSQIDLPMDVESNLNEFSLNLALQEDKRFDEVGPTGEILWYLHRLEPEPVREIPIWLRYQSNSENNTQQVVSYYPQFEPIVIDELEPALNTGPGASVEEADLSLIYPHWRAGTLPLSGSLAHIFPTALESPRIQVTLVDGTTRKKYSGWVVRPFNYVYGLHEWYEEMNLIPGSLVHIQRSRNPGEVIIRAERKRPTREWLRTAVVGSDGGVVFSMLKHNISSPVDERMGLVVSNVVGLDEVWEKGGRLRGPLSQTIKLIMRELAKLSQQSHVHVQELYAGVNILRRCPPGPILKLLLESPWAKHMGNLYFRFDETAGGDTV